MDYKKYHKQYYEKNKEKLLAKQKQYYLDNKEIYKKYYNSNKESIIQRQLEYNVEYDKTPMARANNLLARYKRQDRLNNRGECDFDAKWIVENIFTQPCAHCGKTGWKVIGCNRLDNSKPHTKDNVEPCCFECNIKELKMERSEDGKFKKIMEH